MLNTSDPTPESWWKKWSMVHFVALMDVGAQFIAPLHRHAPPSYAHTKNPSFLTVFPIVAFLLLFLTASCASVHSVVTSTHPQSTANQGNSIVSSPVTSKGCDKPAPISPGTSVYENLNSNGITRSYLLYIPPHYDPHSSYPLVLNFHGHNSTDLKQARLSGFTKLADQQNFIVVYPQGVIGPDGKTGWDAGLHKDPKVNDVLFVSNLLSHLQDTLCVNPYRIYATGFSNGGGMTYVLACKLSARIAAFAPVSGSYIPPDGGCDPTRPVPIMEFHGTADPVVPYYGNIMKNEPPIDLWLQDWATRDACTKGPISFYKQGKVTGAEWTDCRDGVTVIGFRIQGERHIWPLVKFNIHTGTGTYPSSASSVIWSFFKTHPLLPSEPFPGKTPDACASSQDTLCGYPEHEPV
jgi:polyhydroxybutyrate depolymerase